MKKGRIFLVPYPAQGHVSPMHKLASAFLTHGFDPVIVLPHYIHRQLMMASSSSSLHHHDHDGIKWVALPDGTESSSSSSSSSSAAAAAPSPPPPPDFFDIELAMEKHMPSHLEEMLVVGGGDGIVCVVVDLLASWAIKVAESCNIPTAGFWPAMFATYRLIQSIPNMLRTRLISDTGLPQREGKIGFIPDLPIISTEDLPWLIGTVASKKARFKFWKRTVERSRSLKWVLVNSFPDESKVEASTSTSTTTCSQSQGGYPRVLAIGPIFCSSHQQTKNHLSLWEEDLSCLNWLESQKDGSVVYISFGSWVSPIGDAKVKNIALALEASNRPFIWVLRSNWREGLPTGFVERAFKQGRGRVVCWAPQAEILKHKSVGCYLTHCGWNSTLEALQFRKRLLCYPVAGDQFVNCAYIVQVWRVGIRLNGLGQKDVEEGLARVMEEEEQDNKDEMDARLMNLYQTIMGVQGSSVNPNPRGAFFLKAFLEDLSKLQPSTLHSI